MADKELISSKEQSVKSFLYAWCAKRGKIPAYFCRASGPQHRQRFLCELRVPGVVYTACGNSTSKKSSEANAAKDFVEYLIRAGEVQAQDVPVSNNTAVYL